MTKVWRFLLPLGIFAVLVYFLFKGLSLNPREVPSPLVDKPVPNFSLPKLHAPDQKLSATDLKGQVWLLNVWGSWCVSCRIEHPLLNEIAKNNIVPIYGLNWKDKREDAIGWLNKYGDPYVASVADIDGRVAIDFGVYGAPETFVIDKQGIIRMKHIGPISAESLQKDILPLIEKLKKS
ncbi:MAG: DsbE family thiol:disulfide interchange protein [Burkholderiales bacterium]|nr:DsbE family thiol:disulfide interchange protein [Burkholderiales bacterium]